MKELNTRASVAVIFILILAILLTVRGVHKYDAEIASTSTPETNIKQNPSHPDMMTYSNNQYRFSISYPDTFEATTTFDQSYMVGSSWQLYSDPNKNTGMPLIALYKKGSNDVLNAEVRIGVSTSTDDVVSCTKTQDGQTASSTVINGVPFITYEESGAAMMHFSKAVSYRTVRDNTCYAIDEFIAGTNPEVYDPPRILPYNEAEAWNELDAIKETFLFK